MKIIILLSTLIFSHIILSQQFSLKKYYTNFRKFENLCGDRQYKLALTEFMKNGTVWPFNDDRLAFYKYFDSAVVNKQIDLKNLKDSNYFNFRSKLKYTIGAKIMETGFPAIDGANDPHKISLNDLKIDTNYSNDNSRYLFNLISIDRFIGYSRSYLSTPVTDSMFKFLGDITLDVLRKAKLPGREITTVWEHENFYVAILHSLQGLKMYPEKQDSILYLLKQHVFLGNFEAGNYTGIYDRIYLENHNYKISYYGQGFYAEMENGNMITKAYSIFDRIHVNERRKELELIPIEEFYKKYNIISDLKSNSKLEN